MESGGGLHAQNKEFLYPRHSISLIPRCTTVWHLHGPGGAVLLPPSIPSRPLCLGLHLPQGGKLLLLPPGVIISPLNGLMQQQVSVLGR